MKYGAFYNRQTDEIVWFRTGCSLKAGFYRRHAPVEEPPDVYIAESAPELIMKAHTWIYKEEAAFQNEVSTPDENPKAISRISEKMTDQLIQNLDPNDDKTWVDDPHWVGNLQRA